MIRYYIYGLLFALLIGLISQGWDYFGKERGDLQQAAQAYQQYLSGERGETAAQREYAFNRALSLYKGLEEEGASYGTGMLQYNIGNSYYQLQQYPWAVLYYYQALALAPRSQRVEYNLSQARKKLGLSDLKDSGTLAETLFFFHTRLSLPERLQLMFAAGAILLGLLSLRIWYRFRWFKKALIGLVCVFLLFLGSAFTTFFLSPIEAVVVKGTPLYRGAGTQYALVQKDPVPSGVKVQVKEMMGGGDWLQVATNKGKLGYVPSNAVRVIR